jgi:hypothetical protein
LSWVPYASVLLVAVIFFGLGFMKSSDRWEPFAQWLNRAVGQGAWKSGNHEFKSSTDSLIVENLSLANGAIFGLKGPVTVRKLEIVAPSFKDNQARADLLMVHGLANGRSDAPGGAFAGTLAIEYAELQRLDLSGPGPNPAISADSGLAKNLTAAWTRSDGPARGDQPTQTRSLSLVLKKAGFSGGVVLDPSGGLSVNQGSLNGLTITVDPGDDPSQITVASLSVSSLDEKARSQTLELSDLTYGFRLGDLDAPDRPPVDITLGRLKVQSLDLGPMVQSLSHLSLTELAELWLSGPAGQPRRRLSASLALSRPFGAARAELSDLALTAASGQSLFAKEITLSPLTRFNLKAQVKGLGFSLGPGTGPEPQETAPVAAPETSPETATETVMAPPPEGAQGESLGPWLSPFQNAGLFPLSGNLELSSVYEPSDQSYVLELVNLELPGLVSGNLKLNLADIDRASLDSLSHLTLDNPLDPLMESGLHHSKLTSLTVSLKDAALTERLISVAQPRGDDSESLAAKSQRLSDLFEMALTIRFDNVVENTKEIADLIRAFLATPKTIALSVEPQPPLTPGDVRFSRDIPTLMNSINIALSVNERPPLKVLFRTDPAAFDRDYTRDESGLYPAESKP